MKSSQVFLIEDTLQQLSVKLPVSLRLVCLLLLGLMGSQQCLLLPFLLLLIILVLIRACLHHHLTLFTSQLPLLFDGQEASRWGLPPSFVCFAVIIVPGKQIRFFRLKNTDFNLLPSSFFASHHSFPESPAALCHLVPPWGASTLRNPPLTWGQNVNWAEVTSWEAHLSFLHFCHILLSPGQLNLLFVLLCHCTPLLSWRLRPVQKIFSYLFCTFFTRVTATVSQHNSRVPTPCSTINGSSSCIWLSYAGAYPRPCLINNLRATCPYTVLYPAGAHCCKAWLWSLCSRQCLSPSSQSALVGLTNCWLRRRKKTNPMNTL